MAAFRHLLLALRRHAAALVIGAIIVAMGVGAAAWVLLPRQIPLGETATAAAPDVIARGEYLARAGDCIACHTARGGQPYAGGLGLETPFGTIVASNITPDRDTGIGGWSDEAFLRAVKAGVSRDGHYLYPAMPYNAYVKVSDRDLLDIKAYLDHLAPVTNTVPANKLPFPFNIRQMMIGWNLLFFDRSPFKPDPAQTEGWNRGAYLVQGLGHCAACHTAKNLLGGDKAYLQGGLLQGWYAPEITGNPHTGVGGWSVEAVASYLKTGGNAHAVASGPMAEAVHDSTQYLTEADLKAIATYLKSVPGSAAIPVAAADPTQLKQGERVFAAQCSACHRSSGEGVDAMIPALAGSPGVQQPDPNNILRVILEGGVGVTTANNPTGAAMPNFDWKLNDADVAAVATYIRQAWGNKSDPVTPAAAAKTRASLKANAPLGGS